MSGDQSEDSARAGSWSGRRPFVVGPEEGASYELGNSTHTLKVRAEDTSGHFELWKTWLPPGYEGPSPHVHDRLDKAFYVTEGEVEFLVGDHMERGSPGVCVIVPRGAAHTFSNLGVVPARFLMIETAAGREQMFKEMAETLPTDVPPDAEVVDAILRKYDTTPA